MKWLVVWLGIALLAGCKTNVTPAQQVSDVEATAQVKAALAQELGLATVANVSVNVTDGVVTLAGKVDNPDRKARAEQIARAVPKVTRVINNLQTE
jgi:osmotically-inducible protein OsmY